MVLAYVTQCFHTLRAHKRLTKKKRNKIFAMHCIYNFACNINFKIFSMFIEDLNILRKTRQAPTEEQQQQPQHRGLTDSQKLDALATLLASTSYAVRDLSKHLEANVTRLMQQTG